jgi:hypothetical protein
LCKPGTTCTERSVVARDWQDVTLIAQGETVRAFWYDSTNFYCADVDIKGALANQQTLAGVGPTRLVPVKVDDSAMTIVGPQDHPALSVVDKRGKATLAPLAGTALRGTLFLPVVPVVDKPLGVVIVGDTFNAHVTIVDARGTPQKPAPLYARNAYRRVALLPIPRGTHHVRYANLEGDITTETGDLLYLVYDYHHSFAVLHEGVAAFPFKKWPQHVPGTNDSTPEPADVVVDGNVVASFAPTEDVVLGAKHAVPGRSAISRTTATSASRRRASSRSRPHACSSAKRTTRRASSSYR